MDFIVAFALVGLAQASLETYSGSTICVQNDMDPTNPIKFSAFTEST